MSRPTNISIYREAASQPARRLSIVLRAIEVWLVISVVEVTHGVARVAFLQPVVGDFRARQIAVFSGSLLIIATAFVFRRWLSTTSAGDCFVVGGVWVVLTLGFELALARLALDLPWERVLSDYNLWEGGLMPIGLMVMLLTPLIVFRVRDN